MDAERVNRVEKQLDHHLNTGNCAKCSVKGKDSANCINNLYKDALSVIRELKAENDRLKQGNLVDVDKLRERLGLAESCEKCKKDPWKCQRDDYFTEKDFCERLDTAIEELMQEGR